MKNILFPTASFKQCGKSFFVLSFFLLLAYNNFAQGDLLIYPKRITFDGTQERVQIINLNNKGKDSATYKLSFIENRMNEDGKFEIIEEPDSGQLFASPYLRFYPRTITLAPNETQVVKIQLVRTSELQKGEYRSHLYFRPVPKSKARIKNELAPSNPEEVSLKLQPVYGISVANIIRIGEPEAKISLSNLSFERFNDSIPIISMDFNRSGSASSYGDIKVYYISASGKETSVGEANGFAVYTPGKLRKVRMRLRVGEGLSYDQGKLIISYVSQGTKKEIYAEEILEL